MHFHKIIWIKDKILLVSGVCIPIGLLLFVVGAVLARTPTPGAGLVVLVLACLLFIGGVVVFILELVVRHGSERPIGLQQYRCGCPR